MTRQRSLTDNHYDVLGVSQTATLAELGEAERALLRVYEQRAHVGDATATDMMRRLNEAHQTLSEAHKRHAYDAHPDTLWHAFADAAYSPRIERFEKLSAVKAWLQTDEDPVRAHALLDQAWPDELLTHHPLLETLASK